MLNRAFVRDGRPYPPSSALEFELLPGVEEAVAKLKAAKFFVVVVTNQPDVARGTCKEATVDGIHAELRRLLPVDDVLCCFHDDDDQCACRKPKPGMLFDAEESLNIDLKRSFMVGDRWRDIEAGQNAGCTTFFIDYGYRERSPAAAPDHICGSLLEVAEQILQ